MEGLYYITFRKTSFYLREKIAKNDIQPNLVPDTELLIDV